MDDLALLLNTSAKAESLLYSLEKGAVGIGLYVNGNKIGFICFKWEGIISTFNDKPLKSVDMFIYLGSNISSTERNVNTRQANVWAARNRLWIALNSDQSDKIKWDFFQAVTASILLYGCTTWKLTKRIEKRLDDTTRKCYEMFRTASGSKTSQSNRCMATYPLSH